MFERISIVISDHNFRDLLSTVDYSMVLSEGKIVAKGSPNELVKDSQAIAKYFGEGFQY